MFDFLRKKQKIETPTNGTFKLPTNYGAVNLGQYVRWHEAKSPVDKCAAALNISVDQVRKLTPDSVTRINEVFGKVIDTELTSHIKACKLNGREYGFIPCIEDLPIGQYIDLDELSKALFVNNQHDKLIDMMSICYRPITARVGGKYTIAEYTGKEAVDNRDDIAQLPMSVVSGAMLFFSNFEIELLRSSLDYLTTTMAEMQMDLQSTSTSGAGSIS